MKIPVYRLPYSVADRAFIKRHIDAALRRGYLTDGGPYVEQFESDFAGLCGVRYAVAVNSATTALELLLRVIDVRQASVVVPTYTFYATPLSILNAGGSVIYADISRDTLGLSLPSIKKHVQPDTKAVIIVHVGGVVSPEVKAIRAWCTTNGIYLIEDAACAHGASLRGKKAGTFGHAAAFSFHHSKVLTTGEGGMITTNNKTWVSRLRRLRGVGLDRTINNWEIFELGNNYKMSEITAILGLRHVRQAAHILRERRSLARFYDTQIRFTKQVMPFSIPRDVQSAYYKYLVRVADPVIKATLRERLLREYDISLPPNLYDHLCHDQSITRQTRTRNARAGFPDSTYMRDHHICLPMYNGLSAAERAYIVRSFNEVIASV